MNQKEGNSLSSLLFFTCPLTLRHTLLSERLEKSNLWVLLEPVCYLCKNYGYGLRKSADAHISCLGNLWLKQRALLQIN